eukprot:TRINITY_DN813_c0_g1_i1.p1 TRINITY_DN813_c0_g1~~TRINITY_DN813_c0_g1_i1.p1  ORF type:complete len:445 (-),score=130.22 TRINITY_DN813_c0_g1_i1:492-1826(-)
MKKEKTPASSKPVEYKALFDYNPRSAKEIGFKQGDTVLISKSDPSGWSIGSVNGHQGWFPTNYVAPADKPLTATEREQSIIGNKKQTEEKIDNFLSQRPEKEDVAHIVGTVPTGASASSTKRASQSFSSLPTTTAGATSADKKKKSGLMGLFKKKDKKAAKTQVKLPLFAVPLDQFGLEDGEIPPIVAKSIAHIREHGIELEGIFRISGQKEEMDLLAKQYQEDSGFPTTNDPHAVAGILKKFFRELPEPLFTYDFHNQFLETIKLTDVQKKCAVIKELLSSLPSVNSAIITALIPFLKEISLRDSKNMMNIENLGIVFGPTLMRAADEKMGVQTNKSNIVIEQMIQYSDEIFGSAPAVAPLISKKVSEKSQSKLSDSTGSQESQVDGKKGTALYDFSGDPNQGQLSFSKGAVITIIQKHGNGWLSGEYKGKVGYFPENYISLS